MASKYRQRDESLYTEPPINEEYSNNPHILSWWTATHDLVIMARIKRYRWLWYRGLAGRGISDDLLDLTPDAIINHWRDTDPLCRGRTIKSALTDFARTRARDTDLISYLKPAERTTCKLCGEAFIEDSLPLPLIRRIGINQIVFCGPCLADIYFNDVSVRGTHDVSYEDALSYLQELASTLGYIPPRDFGTTPEDTAGLTIEQQLNIFGLLQRRPSIQCVRQHFGSWFQALVQAGVLEDGTQQMVLGTKCLAKDGHVCLSLGEKTIDDLLSSLGIVHNKEVPYPEGSYRVDFVARGVFIEYLGLAGNPDYDAKTNLKQQICKRHGINLLLIYPKHLIARDKLVDMIIDALIEGSEEYNPTYARVRASGQAPLFPELDRTSVSAVSDDGNDPLLFSEYDSRGQLYLFPDAPISRQLLLFPPR